MHGGAPRSRTLADQATGEQGEGMVHTHKEESMRVQAKSRNQGRQMCPRVPRAALRAGVRRDRALRASLPLTADPPSAATHTQTHTDSKVEAYCCSVDERIICVNALGAHPSNQARTQGCVDYQQAERKETGSSGRTIEVTRRTQ